MRMTAESKLEKLCGDIQGLIVDGVLLRDGVLDTFAEQVDKWWRIVRSTKNNLAAAALRRQQEKEVEQLINNTPKCVVTSAPDPLAHAAVKKLFVGLLKAYTGVSSIKVWSDVRKKDSPGNIAGRQIKVYPEKLSGAQIEQINNALREKFNCKLHYIDNREKFYVMSYFRVERL